MTYNVPSAPTEPTPPDEDLLDRYLAGECSELERQTIEGWLREHPDKAVQIGMILYVAQYPLSDMRQGSAAAYEAFASRVKAASVVDRKLARTSRGVPAIARVGRRFVPTDNRGRSLPWLSSLGASSRGMIAAAALFTVVGVGAWVVNHERSVASLGAESVAWKTFTSSRGQRAHIELADGTRIVLAAESQLRVRQAPDRSPNEIVREVELSGEAFFEVAHVGGHPFSVRTPHGVITQLGTSFDVRAYRGDEATQVAVVKGRVTLRPSASDALGAVEPKSSANAGGAAKEPVVLAAGDLGRMTSAGVTDIARGINVAPYTGWMRGELRFSNAPLQSVVDEVERWYDVKVVLGDSTYAAYRLTASLRSGSVDDVLDVVVKSLDLRSKRSGDTIWILRKNTQPTKKRQ